MQSADAYRLNLAQLVASIRAWSGFVGDVARVEIAEEGGIWRIAMVPKTSRACPVELLLDDRSAVCDISIAGETYEGWRPASLDTVLTLLKAVSDGAVVKRRFVSSVTGLPLAVSTEVSLADGSRLVLGAEDVPSTSGIECRQSHFVPYRKPETVTC